MFSVNVEVALERSRTSLRLSQGSDSGGAGNAGAAGSPKILFTKVAPTASDVRRLKALGGEVVTDPTKATHLIADKIARTVRFLPFGAHFSLVFSSFAVTTIHIKTTTISAGSAMLVPALCNIRPSSCPP